MKNPESKNMENPSCDIEFIEKQLKLVVDPQSPSSFLKIDSEYLPTSTDPIVLTIPKLNDPESFLCNFEGFNLVEPEKVCRPSGDTTIFTTAGVQRIESMLKTAKSVDRESFIVCQPVIRSQFMDKVCDGTSTSFVNMSAEIIRSSPDEFINTCKKLIELVVKQGISIDDLRFTTESSSVKWGSKRFNNVALTLYFNGIELGECVYILDYPIGDEKISITDLGLGVERLLWGLDNSKPYMLGFEDFYEQIEDSDHATSIIDCVKSMVLIAGEDILPSNSNQGYRLRQFSKRFVKRNRLADFNINRLIGIAYQEWKKWGYNPVLTEDEVVEVISAENERNFNCLFLNILLQDEHVDLYIDVNQRTDSFLDQVKFSLSQDVITKIVNKIK